MGDSQELVLTGRVLGQGHCVIEADLMALLACVPEEVLDDPDQASLLRRDGDLLGQLSPEGVRGELEHLRPPTRQRPEVVAGSGVEQNPALADGDARDPEVEALAALGIGDHGTSAFALEVGDPAGA